MKPFLVKLKMMIGGFEKTSTNLVYARTEDAAKRRALRAECHNKIGTSESHSAWWSGDFELTDDDGGMVYSFQSLTKIDDAIAERISAAF